MTQQTNSPLSEIIKQKSAKKTFLNFASLFFRKVDYDGFDLHVNMFRARKWINYRSEEFLKLTTPCFITKKFT